MTTPKTPAQGATEAPSDERVERIHEALSGVIDPEIHRPITELGMVGSVDVDATVSAPTLASGQVDREV